MANEVAEVKKSEVVVTSKALVLQNKILAEIEKANEEFEVRFTEYGTRCAKNCLAGIITFCKNNSIPFENIDQSLLKLQVQNIGYTELNYASIPSEIYFDLRKTTVKYTDKETGEEKTKEVYSIAIKPQGAGNEKLVRKYGVGLKKDTGLHNAILIREKDEFIMPQYNGIEITPPVYKPRLENANNKVVAVMYPAEKVDGSVEYLIATRDSVKANIIAQIRQNTLYTFKKKYTAKNGKEYETNDKEARDKFYEELNKKAENMTVDEMLADEEILKYVNPTYTSGGSKEQMILRKMKNNALKNYPKEYDNSVVKNAVNNMFEENDESVLERKDITKKVERELDEDLNDDVIDDFDVIDAEVEVKETEKEPAKEKVEVKEKKSTDVPF